MEPRIVSEPAFSVVGVKIRAQGGSPEIPGLWDVLGPRADEIVGKVSGAALGGIDNFDRAKGEFDYVAGFQIEGTHGLPSGMAAVRLPTSTRSSNASSRRSWRPLNRRTTNGFRRPQAAGATVRSLSSTGRDSTRPSGHRQCPYLSPWNLDDLCSLTDAHRPSERRHRAGF